MALTTEQRQELFAEFQRYESSNKNPIDCTKPDLKAAVDGIDDWIDSNQASFNAAIPLPARTSLTMKQKLRLFMKILDKRWEVE